MSPEERQLLTGLFDRIRGQAAAPRDPEAEALIANAVKAMPYAPYLLAQAVIVQDQALRAANERLQQLEAKLQELEQQAPPQLPGGGFLSGLGSLFGGGAPAPQPRAPSGPWQQAPQPGYQQQPYAPPQAPPAGPWGSGGPMGGGGPMGSGGTGGGFLQGALSTAAGVAGGVLLANSIRGLFGGGGGLGIASGLGGSGGGETVVNNYYDDSNSTQDADFAGNGSDSYEETTYDNSDSADPGDDDGSYDV